MVEALILGTVQGIAEWLPVSSEGLITFIQLRFLESMPLGDIVRYALFLHLGTFCAALIYFRIDIKKLIRTAINFKSATDENKKLLAFLIISTFISGILGILLLETLEQFEEVILRTAKSVTILIGVLLLITGGLQYINQNKAYGTKEIKDINVKDGVMLGIIQGLAVLPGLSRSGLTVAALILRKFDDAPALKISFLLSLPIVLAGNILLNLNTIDLTVEKVIGFLCAFGFGLLTIHYLLQFAKKVNMSYVVATFGILMIASAAW